MDGTSLSSPTPFTPPTTEEDRLAWLRLIRSRRVGPATFFRLLDTHHTVQAALDALPDVAAQAGVDDYAACSADTARREIEAGVRAGARMICLGDACYPPALAAMTDPPPVLWAMGKPHHALRPALAIVGARAASSLGLRTARKLAEGAGYHGLVVVSGLARGVDTAAHGAALRQGTIAVMAGGVDVVYPAENAVLAAAIADQGLRLSEQPMGLQPQARHFPRRNRLIAGLSRAVVVIEAAEASGSLITARDALDLGREIMAVPGHPADARSAGANALIREGAVLVRGIDDVIEALNDAGVGARDAAPERRTADTAARGHHGTVRPEKAAGVAATTCRPVDALVLHQRILTALGAAPLPEDQLLRDLALPAEQVLPALLFLELDNRIKREGGGMISRV